MLFCSMLTLLVVLPLMNNMDGLRANKAQSWGVSQGASNTPVTSPSDAKVSFFDNLLKKLDSSSSSQKKIFGFPYLSLKLSLTLPHKGKMLWCSYFRSLIKLANFSRCGNFTKKLNFVSTLWKIIRPLVNSVGDHIRVIEIHLGG